MAENLETLLQTAREQNESGLGLPKYVEKEFRDFLRWGVLWHGFGVFGPHSSWRKLCVPEVVDSAQTEPPSSTSQSPDSTPTAPDSDGAKASPDPQRATSESGAAVVNGTKQSPDPSGQHASPKLAASIALNPSRIDWATLLKRTYDFDVLVCDCGGRFKAVEVVTKAERAKELLEQFGMSTKPPPIARARSPDCD